MKGFNKKQYPQNNLKNNQHDRTEPCKRKTQWNERRNRADKLMKSNYYIYLLPVNRGNSYSLDKLKMIQDPIAGILDSPETWDVETDLVRCNLIAKNES